MSLCRAPLPTWRTTWPTQVSTMASPQPPSLCHRYVGMAESESVCYQARPQHIGPLCKKRCVSTCDGIHCSVASKPWRAPGHETPTLNPLSMLKNRLMHAQCTPTSTDVDTLMRSADTQWRLLSSTLHSARITVWIILYQCARGLGMHHQRVLERRANESTRCAAPGVPAAGAFMCHAY